MASVGRPKKHNKRIAKAFRLRPEIAELIDKAAQRNRISQVRLVELVLSRFADKIDL